MVKSESRSLSRRERQIMDILYQRGQASASDVHTDLPDAPSYSTVRTLLRVLKDKCHVKQKYEGPRYVYTPIVPAQKARRRALENLILTFFGGSAEQAIATLIDMASMNLSRSELQRLKSMIDQARDGEKQ